MTAEYSLPFDPNENPVHISQGCNGPWSHKILDNGQHSINAIDFVLPPGSPILAAREGRVMGVIDDSDLFYSGIDAKIGLGLPPGSTNMIWVQHADGTNAYYLHLEMGSARVKRGQRVQQGEEIGLTGLSGWIGPDPHLHFQVNDRDSGESLPITFRNYSGPLEHREIYPPAEGENTLL